MKVGRSLKEPTSDKAIVVSKKLKKKEIMDGRNGLRCGSLVTMCAQYGIKMETRGSELWLSAPKDRLQSCLEKLHFSNIPYTIQKY